MTKDFKPMKCPVCHQYYFVDDLDFEKTQPDYEGKEDDFCSHCGWKYDLYQVKHPNVGNRSNELSLNEYKKWFAKQIKKDPNYDYSDSNYSPTSHRCPVCGKYEFSDESSFEICPYCGWEDDGLMEYEPDSWEGCANPLCLNDYKKDYQQKIKENPNYKWKNNNK